MLLEDASSRNLSSVDFGRAAEEGRRTVKGLGLPQPTEFIEAPKEVLDTEAALLEAEREKSSIRWRVESALRRMAARIRDRIDRAHFAVTSLAQSARERAGDARVRLCGTLEAAVKKLQSLRPKPKPELPRAATPEPKVPPVPAPERPEVPPSPAPERPEVPLSPAFALSSEEQDDTDRTEAPRAHGPSNKPKPRGSSQWEVTTQIVDMRKRKRSRAGAHPGQPNTERIQVSDLVLAYSPPDQPPT